MTTEQIQSLRILIAEDQGWKEPFHPDVVKLKQNWLMPEKWWLNSKGVLCFRGDIPNYTTSLDAIWLAIQEKDETFKIKFNQFLYRQCGDSGKMITELTATDWSLVYAETLKELSRSKAG